ncbi:MAG: biotin transporter BioY [Desulforudis sp.]|nr:MAG: biotin transporter BioY [Desulforudis sp.]
MIGIAAQVRVPVPWSPVPITGQTFAVLLAGILLGRNWGGFSVGIYAGAGALGLPWFQGLAGGLAYVAGPTGGYILGFVIAAAFVGYAVRKMPLARTLPGLLGLMLFANFVIIHGIGLLHLSNLTGITSPAELLWLGTIPFIPGDLTKVALAAAVAVVLLPRELNRKQ